MHRITIEHLRLLQCVPVSHMNMQRREDEEPLLGDPSICHCHRSFLFLVTSSSYFILVIGLLSLSPLLVLHFSSFLSLRPFLYFLQLLRVFSSSTLSSSSSSPSLLLLLSLPPPPLPLHLFFSLFSHLPFQSLPYLFYSSFCS